MIHCIIKRYGEVELMKMSQPRKQEKGREFWLMKCPLNCNSTQIVCEVWVESLLQWYSRVASSFSATFVIQLGSRLSIDYDTIVSSFECYHHHHHRNCWRVADRSSFNCRAQLRVPHSQTLWLHTQTRIFKVIHSMYSVTLILKHLASPS